MTVQGLSIVATLRNGVNVALGGRSESLKWREGRAVGSWYEQPSLLTMSVRVADDFITEDDSGMYSSRDLQGAALDIRISRPNDGQFIDVWQGFISTIGFNDPDIGIESTVTIEAYDLTEKLSNADQEVTDPTIVVARETNREIELAGGVATSPRGMVATDELFLIVDSSDDHVYAWRVSDLSRYTTGDFVLTNANSNPQGICTDGVDLFWVVDGTDHIAYAYSSARRFSRYAAGDIDFSRDIIDIVWQTDQLSYLSGTKLYDQSDVEITTLNVNNANPASVLFSQYLDGDTERNQFLVWDSTDDVLYIYRESSSSTWTYDNATNWEFASSAGLTDSEIDRAFEGLNRIFVPPELEWYTGNSWHGQPATLRTIEAYTIVSIPARDSSSDITFLGQGSIVGQNTYSWSLGGMSGTPMNIYGRRYYLRAARSSLVISFRRRGRPYIEFVATALGQQFSAGHPSHAYSSNSVTGRPATLGANDDNRLLHGSDTGVLYEAPPVELLPDADTIADASTVPARSTFPDNSEWRRYAMSDDYIFIADLLDNFSGTGNTGLTNSVSVYDADTLERGPTVTLNIPSGFDHPNGSADNWAIVAMYWARGHLFIRMGRITGTGTSITISDGVGPWLAWRPDFTSFSPWASSGTISLVASGGGTYVLFDGLHYLLLDSTDGEVQAYALNGDRVTSLDFSLASANTDPLAMCTDGTYLYVGDGTAESVYVYNLSDGSHETALGFSLANSTILGMAYDPSTATIYVGQTSSAHAYRGPENPESPSYVPGLNISLDTDVDPTGCVSDGTTVYVCTDSENEIRAYDIITRSRISSLDIAATTAGSSYRGLTNDGESIFALSSSDNHIYAFSKEFRTRQSHKDFQLFDIVSGPQAVTFIGNRMYVAVDVSGTEHVFAYNVSYISEVARPRETSLERYKALGELVLDDELPMALTGGRSLPAKDVSGTARVTLRRCLDAELGRAIDGRLYPRGQWAVNDGTGGPVTDLTEANAALVITDASSAGADSIKSPIRDRVDALIVNQLVLADSQDVALSTLSADSASQWGRKGRTVETDAMFSDIPALAEFILDHWDNPYPVMDVSVSLLYQSAEVATAALAAKLHTPVTVVYEGVTRPWLVLHREVKMRPVGNATIDIVIRYLLISPRQFGIGWVLDGPDELIEDRLGMDTILIDKEY